MKAAERKKELATQLSDLRIEFSVDDDITTLVLENTRGVNQRMVHNIVRCLTLIAGGTSLATSCKLTGISTSRLNHWRSKEWYARAIELIKQRMDDQLDGKFTHAINKGLDKLQTRLDEGDPIVDTKTGTVKGHKPVSARDAAIITSIFFDKRNLLRNKPTSITSTQSTEERLTVLAGKFREIATDGEYYEVDEYEQGEQAQANAGDEEAVGRELGYDIQPQDGAGTDKDTEEDADKWAFKAS